MFTIQLAARQRKVRVPQEYFRPYPKAGIDGFEFEVGAKLEENQTFSEGGFTVERDD